MSGTTRNRRTSTEKWEADIKAQEEKIQKLQDKLNKATKELEELKAKKPLRFSNCDTPTLISKLAKDPNKLNLIFSLSAGDENKLKRLLIKALNELSIEEDTNNESNEESNE